jgi:HK97 family phage major capsid protein
MSTLMDIKQAIDTTAEAFEEFKKVNDKRLEDLKAGRDAQVADAEAKLAKLEEAITTSTKEKQAKEREMEFLRERVEELEAKTKLPGRTAAEKLESEYKTAFMSWIRNRGASVDDERKMMEIQKKAIETKADITIGSGAGGGYAVPEEISRAIEKHELLFSPVRSLVKVVRAGTSDYKELLNVNGATGGWIGESGTRSATASPQLREITPTHGELYAYPQVSEWSLDDIFFNVEAWLAENVGEAFAIAEATAVLTGDGSSKPTGMLNSAPTAVSDATATRAAAVYEFVAGVNASLLLDPDWLFDMQVKLNSAYQANAYWLMNSVTAGVVRKLRETDPTASATGQYLWQPSLIVGQPDTLLGKPISIWEQMANIGNAAHPIAYGDFRRGYVLADRVGMRVTRDNVTNVGFIRFYMRRREGGIVLNNNAIKWLKTTTA